MSSEPKPEPAVLTVEDLSLLLKVSIRSVWRLAAQGVLPKPVQLGRSVRWSKGAVLAWLDARSQPVAATEEVGDE